MRRTVFCYFALFIFSGLNGPPCTAQLRLSLDDAVSRALQSRASLKAEAERVNAAEGLRRQAQLRSNPDFQFQNENLRPGQTYTRDVDTLATINQPLDILGKRRERIAAADEAVNRAGADYELAQWQVSQQVKLAYWSARGAQEIREVLRTTVANFQRIVDYHAAQLSAGAIAEQDLLRIRLEHERLGISADLAGIDANRARIELLREMGETDFPELVLTEPWTAPAPSDRPALTEVLARRVDVRAARVVVEQARAAVRVQDVAARPDLNLILGYKRTQLPDTAAGVNTALASVRITLPFADRNQGNRASAEAEVRRAEQQLAAVEAGVRAEYYAASQEFQMRRTEFETMLQPLREHAVAIAQIANATYAEGGTDLLRLLDAERARLEAELAWTRGMIEYQQSAVRLAAAEGVNP